MTDEPETLPGDPDPWPSPTEEQIDALLALLPATEAAAIASGHQSGPPSDLDGQLQLPTVGLFELARRFRETAKRTGFVVAFDWREWLRSPDGQVFQRLPESALLSADVKAIQRILTASVGTDQISGEHLQPLLESGCLTTILRRLEEINRADRGRPRPAHHANAFEEMCRIAVREQWCAEIPCTTCGNDDFRRGLVLLSRGLHPADRLWNPRRADVFDTIVTGQLESEDDRARLGRLAHVLRVADARRILAMGPRAVEYLRLAREYIERHGPSYTDITQKWQLQASDRW